MGGFNVEVILRRTKWLLCCSYDLARCKIYFQLENLNQSLALYSSLSEHLIIMADFNVQTNDRAISLLRNTYDLKSLIKEPTCFKSSNKPSSINLILTNKPRRFQHSCVIEAGLIFTR